jgi:N-acetylglucosaminyldiphosphoundecaprenol N-acetyl-beta-D-mannosaminyltransferase
MLSLCDLSGKKGYKNYFLGSTNLVLERLRKRLTHLFPKLNVVGHYSRPFRQLSREEEQQMLDDINQANPDILWVGLGSPKQEFWMHEHRDQLKVPIMIGVGAAFDFLSGVKRQAPQWVRKAGLEWLFRLCCEPRRLWKRYLVGNTLFIFYLIRQSLTNSWRDSSREDV